MRRIRAVAAAFAVAALAGCSAQVFEKETASFASSASGVEKVWTELYDRIDASAQAERDRLRVRERWALSIDPSCGQFAFLLAQPVPADADEDARKAFVKQRNDLLEGCQLYERQSAVPLSDARRVQVNASDRRLLIYTKAITDYSASLASLTAAQDEDALRAAATDMAGSLSEAGASLQELGDLEFDVAGPVTALSAVYAEARLASLDRLKYNPLVDVVRATDPAIQRMTTSLAEVEAPLRAGLLQAQFDAIRTADRDLFTLPKSASRTERAKRQQAMIDRMAEYKAFAGTLVDGGASYTQVGAAHAALLATIEDPDKFELAKQAADRLKELGEAVKDAANAFGADF
ncbi:MAG: hypothetical protein ACFB03_19200 [Paracoccaceae bacterium]